MKWITEEVWMETVESLPSWARAVYLVLAGCEGRHQGRKVRVLGRRKRKYKEPTSAKWLLIP
jgi:hypothetical protein